MYSSQQSSPPKRPTAAATSMINTGMAQSRFTSLLSPSGDRPSTSKPPLFGSSNTGNSANGLHSRQRSTSSSSNPTPAAAGTGNAFAPRPIRTNSISRPLTESRYSRGFSTSVNGTRPASADLSSPSNTLAAAAAAWNKDDKVQLPTDSDSAAIQPGSASAKKFADAWGQDSPAAQPIASPAEEPAALSSWESIAADIDSTNGTASIPASNVTSPALEPTPTINSNNLTIPVGSSLTSNTTDANGKQEDNAAASATAARRALDNSASSTPLLTSAEAPVAPTVESDVGPAAISTSIVDTIDIPTPVTSTTVDLASIDDAESDEDREFLRHLNRKHLDALNAAASNGEPIINSLYLLYDPPVETCELKPYVSITDGNGTLCTLESLDRHSDGKVTIEWEWIASDRRLCSALSCNNTAKLQCMQCVKSDLPDETSYWCSVEHCQQHWQTHNKEVHQKHIQSLQQQQMSHVQQRNAHGGRVRKAQTMRPVQIHQLKWMDDDLAFNDSIGITNQELAKQYYNCKFPVPPTTSWQTVKQINGVKDSSSAAGTSRVYCPTKLDVGRHLRINCWPVYTPSGKSASIKGKTTTIETSPVLALPSPPPPRNLSYNPALHQRNPISPFRTICYNALAPIYATQTIYPYTPLWALTWEYRKNLLIREILSYNADVICLQEVQTDHFYNFYSPQLSAAGYDGCFKAKTRDLPSWSIDTSTPGATASPSIDGCATFYRRDRFVLLEKHEIEFNEIVKRSGFTDKRVLRRLMKGNVGLAVVLEELTEPSIVAGLQRRQKKRRICIANTHIYWDPEFADVKLWQAWALTTELEKLVLGRALPLILCGDWNSMADSSVYELLTTSRVAMAGADAQQAMANANLQSLLGTYLPADLRAVHHRLPLVSAYASCDAQGLEPAYTNYTRHFCGTLDYVLYTPQQLQLLTCLDVDSEAVVSTHTALPSPTHPSDHIALCCDFDWM